MIYNRWHPDIPIVKTVKPGDDFIIECYDWTGGQIANNDCADDVRDVDLSQVHFLSGPVGIESALMYTADGNKMFPSMRP